MHIVFKDNLVISSIIPNYFNNSETPIICYEYNSNYLYPPAGHVITGNLNVIPDARICNIISKGPKYRFPSSIDFSKCRGEIVASLNAFSNCWCK